MRASWLLATTLALGLACGGGDAPVIVDHDPVAAVPTTPAFDIEVTLDAAAKAELVQRKERIVVDFTAFDRDDDEGTAVRHEHTLPSEGGVVKVPSLTLTPGPSGEPLRYGSINVWTARESSERNLLSCDYWGGDTAQIPDKVTIHCTLI